MYLVDSILKGKFYMKYTFQSNENNPKKKVSNVIYGRKIFVHPKGIMSTRLASASK